MVSRHCQGQGLIECLVFLSIVAIFSWFLIQQSYEVTTDSSDRFSKVRK